MSANQQSSGYSSQMMQLPNIHPQLGGGIITTTGYITPPSNPLYEEFLKTEWQNLEPQTRYIIETLFPDLAYLSSTSNLENRVYKGREINTYIKTMLFSDKLKETLNE